MELYKHIYLINSSYSRSKIIKNFSNTLKSFGIEYFKVTSNIIKISNITNSNFTENSNKIVLSLDDCDVTFEYYDNNYILEKKDIEILVTNFIISIRNSNLYTKFPDELALCKKYPQLTFKQMLQDIDDEIEIYKQYDSPFALLKVIPNNTDTPNIDDVYRTLKSIMRSSDKVYLHKNSLYVLLKNFKESDTNNLLKKIENKLPNNQFGIANWDFSYVIMDLISEVDNNVYFRAQKNSTNHEKICEAINYVLYKATTTAENIVILLTETKNNLNLHSLYDFEFNKEKFSIVKAKKIDINMDDIRYKFNFEDDAKDILSKL